VSAPIFGVVNGEVSRRAYFKIRHFALWDVGESTTGPDAHCRSNYRIPGGPLNIRRISPFAALLAAGALALAGCQGSDGGSEQSTESGTQSGAAEEPAPSGGVVIANITEPQNPLIPTTTNEVQGGKLVDLLFAGLVYYDADGAAINEVAESIDTEDAQTYTITLQEGWTFSDGSPVTAQCFTDAWSYGANANNAQLNSYFFESIVGYDELQEAVDTGEVDEDGEPILDPVAEPDAKLSGLTVVDDTHFTVTLKQPESDFPLRVGYSAFYPLPLTAFDDIKAFGQNPVGNGPYMFSGPDAWVHEVSVDLVPNPDYKGGRVPQNEGVLFKMYDSPDSAWADLLSGQLDITDLVPDQYLTTFEADLGDRAVNQPAAIFQSFTIPERLAHFDGEEGNLRRKALSHAINREEITDVIFQGTRTPASDFTSPVIDGWSDTLEGADVLAYDEALAKDLWAQADAISPWDGTFKIAYNSDGPHQSWVDAVCNSIKNTLGIEAEGDPYPSFGEMRTAITDRVIETAFRSGWQADYPSLFNFLGPLYGTGAGSNDGDYSSAEVDDLLSQGLNESNVDAAVAAWQQVQAVLLEDLPAIPLWYQNGLGATSEAVGVVPYGWNSVPLYYLASK
jgi:oligopeptide transport system substrate-binding protein